MMEPHLPNAVNDALAIQKVLEEKYDFRTMASLFNENATERNLRRIFIHSLLDEMS